MVFTSDNGSPQRDGTQMSGAIGSVKKYGHDPSKPWRGMKADIWEGGHRVPFIVSWPGHIPENTVNDQLICLTDLMATCAGILDIPLHDAVAEDSHDFSPYLFGKTPNVPVRKAVVHHSIDGTFAIRKGPWKLILGNDSGGFSKNLPAENHPVETVGQLYEMNNDPSEQNNVYEQYPDIVRELTILLHQYQTKGYSKAE
jgi:arylsulfatase A-like enzyme